ncbi:tetratricopeptide repeat protein [soil metagenome]
MTPLPDFDALWDYNDPAATEEIFRRILHKAITSGLPPYPDTFELETQIIRAMGMQGKFESAFHYLNGIEPRVGPKPSRKTVRFLLEGGRLLNSSGRREDALPVFKAAWETARSIGEDALAVDAAHMVAIAESPENQLEWNLRAMELAQSSTDPKAGKWLGSLYNNIGWTYHDRGEFETALTTFELGLVWQREHGTRDARLIAEWTVGRTLRSLGSYESAIAIHEASLRERTEASENDGYIHEELGECLLALDRIPESRPHFAAAHRLLSEDSWLASNEPDRLERLRSRASDA